MNMKIKVKKLHPDAVLPKNANPTDAGYDLVAIDDGTYADDYTYIQYRTGISVQPENGYHTEILARSSITKTNLMLGNGIGLIDQNYLDELFVRFKIIPTLYSSISNFKEMWVPPTWFPKIYKKGDRIAQLVVRKTVSADFEWVEELDTEMDRGGGFGSSGV